MKAKENKVQKEGAVLFAFVFLIASLILLSQLGAETKFSSRGQLFAQPRFWPGVGVLGMALFGAAHLAMTLRRRWAKSGAEALIWLRAVEYFVWFMVYVFAVPIVGYLAATICFTALLALRQGYRGVAQIGAAVGIGIAVVLIFKTGLSVKIPGGAVYEYLPSGLRNFMIVNF